MFHGTEIQGVFWMLGLLWVLLIVHMVGPMHHPLRKGTRARPPVKPGDLLLGKGNEDLQA